MQLCDVMLHPQPSAQAAPPGLGYALTPHAGAEPRVLQPGVGCRRLTRVELNRRQVTLGGRRAQSGARRLGA